MTDDAGFLRPLALLALAAVPAVAWLLRHLDAAGARRTQETAGLRAHLAAPALAASRRGLRAALFAGGLVLGVVALAGPVWGASARDIEHRGADVVVCLDVSRSMLARDVAPSRLDRARAEIAALAGRAQGDRLALVAFAGEARMLVPLTRDGATLAEVARHADPLSVAKGGTDLGAALDAALAALEGGEGGAEAIVLLSDGEDLGGAGLRAADRCRARGIAVHCAALGTALGSKVALDGPGGPQFLRDRSGAEVVSALDAASLRRIAEVSGGTFVDASAAPGALTLVYEESLLPLARRTFDSERRRRREDRFQWPLLGALVLWLLEMCLPDRRRPA